MLSVRPDSAIDTRETRKCDQCLLQLNRAKFSGAMWVKGRHPVYLQCGSGGTAAPSNGLPSTGIMQDAGSAGCQEASRVPAGKSAAELCSGARLQRSGQPASFGC